MARTTTLTQGARYSGGSTISGASFTENITTPNDELLISDTTFTIEELLPTAMTGKIVWSSLSQGIMEPSISAKINGTSMGNVIFYSDSTQGTLISWASGATKTLILKSNAAYTRNTSAFFNSNNPTVRSFDLEWSMGTSFNFNGVSGSTFIEPTVSPVTSSFSQKITLNVPPTAIVSAISYDKPFYYAGLTTATVTVSDVAAYYGGSVTDVTFRIGQQTDTKSGNGTFSILLDTAGTFTPTLTVTDSRGQTFVTTYAPITVLTYSAPTVNFTADRTTSAGVPDDEGTYATCPSIFIFADAIADLIAPSVVLTDENGTQSTPTVTWYTTRAADGTLSGVISDWSSVSAGDTVYGLVPGLNTNYSYQISIRPRDSQGTGTAITQTIASAFYTVDFLAGGHGIAFGKPASNVGFECAMGATFDNPVVCGDTLTANDLLICNNDVYIDLSDYQTSGTTDEAIYNSIVALGWDNDVFN